MPMSTPVPSGPGALAAAALIALAARCGGPAPADRQPRSPAPSPAASPAPPTPPTAVTDRDSAPPAGSLVRLHAARQSGFAEPATLVVQDAGAWRSAWEQVLPRRSGAPEPPPAVDFRRFTVLVVALGERPNGGYAVRVDAAEPAAAGGLVVRYTVTRPSPDAITTQVITSPVEVVRVPRATGPVRFEARERVAPAG